MQVNSLFVGDVVWENDTYCVTLWQGTLRMYVSRTIVGDSGWRCGKMVSGVDGFNRKYKGDYNLWVQDVQKRDKKTSDSYLSQSESLLRSSETLLDLHGIRQPRTAVEYPQEVQLLIEEIIHLRDQAPANAQGLPIKQLCQHLLNFWDRKRPMNLVCSHLRGFDEA